MHRNIALAFVAAVFLTACASRMDFEPTREEAAQEQRIRSEIRKLDHDELFHWFSNTRHDPSMAGSGAFLKDGRMVIPYNIPDSIEALQPGLGIDHGEFVYFQWQSATGRFATTLQFVAGAHRGYNRGVREQPGAENYHKFRDGLYMFRSRF